jgi:hypothetical protein
MRLPRLADLFLLAPLALAALPTPSPAESLAAPRPETTRAPDLVQVAGRCGPGHRWVRSYRDRYGHWVRARCVPSRHHSYYRHEYRPYYSERGYRPYHSGYPAYRDRYGYSYYRDRYGYYHYYR